MKNKTKIFLGVFLTVAGVSQLCASNVLSKRTWADTLRWYAVKTILGVDAIDRYSHSAMTVFASCCVAPWLVFKGQKTEALKLGVGAVGNLALCCLGSSGKNRYEEWASIPTGPTKFDSVKYQAFWYPMPSFAISFLQNSLRHRMTFNVLRSISSVRNQQADSALDKYIIFGGIACGAGQILFDYVLPVRNLVVAVGIKMLWPAVEKNRYYGK